MSEDEFEPYVVHRQTSPHYELLADNVHYPVSHRALRELIGLVLTHLDAMGLPERAHKAAKTLIVRDAWRWWDGVHENATTSGAGCLAPVVLPPDHSPWSTKIGAARPDLIGNRWGWASEDEYLASVTKAQEVGTSSAGDVHGRADGADSMAAVTSARPGYMGPVTFTINGMARTMASRTVSYDEIANLAGCKPDHIPTVTYDGAAGPKPEGALAPGESVEVTERTRIDCVVTGNA